jgi:Protein of unknown function (DUF3037)
VWYSYALVRLVPRVERGEFLNVGVVLFCRQLRFLGARIALDPDRLTAFAPGLDLEQVGQHLRTFAAIADGDPAGGALADLPPAERFYWLTAPRSTVIQTSPVHVGRADDPRVALDELVERYVLPTG